MKARYTMRFAWKSILPTAGMLASTGIFTGGNW